jgi:Arc/MetJ-type ribon-helix-helix transcriptional regulator
MLIHIPRDLERSIEEVVDDGRFASVDDAMAEAARLLLREINRKPQAATSGTTDALPDPLLGSLRDAADELDQIVADAMKRRHEEPWRAISVE